MPPAVVPPELPSAALTRRYEVDLPTFETTAQLDDVFGLVGQPRAAAAVTFGTGMERPGFNIFAFGPPGSGKRSFLRQYLEALVADEPTPPDLCYVHNFEMSQLDPDFAEHFKVAADFDATMDADGERVGQYARLLATLARQELRRQFSAGTTAQ